ncbi:hypothetical protein PAXRUDRAFT_131715, partial [Paxillus rubicundulus Ve08.2h10]
TYPCTVICWFNKIADEPDEDTSMWMVHPSHLANNSPNYAVVHINSIYCVAHLAPIYRSHFVSPNIQWATKVLQSFYVNKFVDHHTFEIAS